MAQRLQLIANPVALEARHRARARVEDRCARCAKDIGLENFPFTSGAANQVWWELVLAAPDVSVFYQRLPWKTSRVTESPIRSATDRCTPLAT